MDKIVFKSQNEELLAACKKGDLKKVKILLKNGANIHYKKDKALVFAAQNGHKDLVRYVLTSPELKEHANIHSNRELALKESFNNHQYDTVKYLISSPELKERANIHTGQDAIFIQACQSKNEDFIRFLVFEFNINKTDSIKNYLQSNQNTEIEKMFFSRDLKNAIENEIHIIHDKHFSI